MPHDYAAAGTSNAGYHEWRPYTRHRLVIGDGYGIALARVMLHEVRWREQPRQWILRITSGVLVVLVYGVALVMLAVVRPAGSGSETGTGTGAEGSATVAVRMINQPAATPAPAPPPIVLPQRPAAPAPQPAAPEARKTPTTAMPPIPVRAPPRPQVALAPTQPQVTAAKPTVTVPQTHLTPTPPEAPPITLPSPNQVVVEEPSSRAIAVPEPQAIRLEEPETISSSLQPVPVEQSAPEITLSKPQLEAHVPASAPMQPVAAVQVQAALPPVPTVAPRATPELPVADVPLSTQVPPASASVAVAAPQAVVASPVPPSAKQAAKPVPPTVSPASSRASWALANDQFKSAPEQGAGRASAAQHTSGQPGTVKLVPRGNSNVMTRNSDRLGYKPTIFNQYWAPANESILDTFLRHFIEKLTVKHTFHLAPGIRVHCVLGPVAVFLACGGDPPRPRPANSSDRRLNMAPARSLVPQVAPPATVRPAAATTAVPGQPVSVPPAHLKRAVKCAAAKVADSPPPPGCPRSPAPATSAVVH